MRFSLLLPPENIWLFCIEMLEIGLLKVSPSCFSLRRKNMVRAMVLLEYWFIAVILSASGLD